MENKDSTGDSKKAIIEQLKAELVALDNEMVDIDGISVKPSKCYHVDVDPIHVLFNTNCPAALKEKIELILAKYLDDETGSQQ